MKITKQVMGFVETNTYYIEKDGKVIVIDPCIDPQKDTTRLFEPLYDKEVSAILITHGHFDHISGIDAIVTFFNCPVYVYHKELEWLRKPSLNLSNMTPEPISVQAELTPIELGPLKVDDFIFEVIETPGHTSGSISYILGQHIFDGDFIFYDSVGRMDLATGSERTMVESLKIFIDTYKNQNIKLYPGHGEITTLKREMKHNPFINHYLNRKS